MAELPVLTTKHVRGSRAMTAIYTPEECLYTIIPYKALLKKKQAISQRT